MSSVSTSKIILPTGHSCTREAWYITENARACRCERRMILKVGQIAPPCPKCGKAVNWVLIESKASGTPSPLPAVLD